MFWPADDPIQLGGEFGKVYARMQQGKVSKSGRTDIYLHAPAFVGIKLRGAGAVKGDRDRDHSKLVWEVKMRSATDAVNGIVGFEGWRKSLHKWGEIEKHCERFYRGNGDEMGQVRAAMKANVEIAVGKKRVSFGSKRMTVGCELTALTIEGITVNGKPVDLDKPGVNVKRRWYTICIETNRGNKQQMEHIAEKAREVVSGNSQGSVEFMYGGYPTWINAFDLSKA